MPKSIGRLTNLSTLDLRNNELTSLPKSIGRLTNSASARLYLWDNPLKEPPLEIAEEGINAIREYFRQKQGGEDSL